jgi:hypothetical protein
MHGSCSKSILLAYERAKRRKVQEDKGIFKHEPTSNADYNQNMDMENEGMEQDKAYAIKMMAFHGRNVPDDTRDPPRGLDYYWSKPHFPRRADLWNNAEKFLEGAIKAATSQERLWPYMNALALYLPHDICFVVLNNVAACCMGKCQSLAVIVLSHFEMA